MTATAPGEKESVSLDATAPRCPRHEGLGAAATCRRCGRFVCSRCTEDALHRPTVTCPECLVALEQDARPRRLRAFGAQLIASWLGVAALFMVVGAGLVAALEGDLATRVGVLVLIAPGLVLLLLATALFAATRKPVFGWAATVLESLMLLPLWVTSPSVCTALLAAAPVFAVVRLVQMRELAS